MWPFTPRRTRTASGPPEPGMYPQPFNENRAITSVPWSDEDWETSGAPDMDRALSLAPVYGCARILADTLSSLPLDLYRRIGDKQEELPTPSLFTHPAIRGTLFDWMHRLVTSLALRGNAYGLITSRDYLGFPTTVEWMNPADVHVADGAAAGPGSYMNPTWYVGGHITPEDNIVHIPWFCLPWRVIALSPIGAFTATINTGLASQRYTHDWYDNGGVPPGTFKNSERTISKDDADIITSRLTTRIKSRKPLIYGSDWDYHPIAINPNEARFVESARLTATQIATIYGVDPLMVGGEVGGSLNYTSTEQMGIRQLTYTFGPWINRIEQALSALFPRGTFVKFNVDALLRTDAATRWGTVYKNAIELGVMSVQEVRDLEDLGPKPRDLLPPKPTATPTSLPPSEQPPNGQQPANGQKPAANGQPANGKPAVAAPAVPKRDDQPPVNYVPVPAELRDNPPIRHWLPPDPWQHLDHAGNGWTRPR